MSIKDTLVSIFSRAPSKNKEDWDGDFLVDKIPPEWFPLRNRKFWWCAHYSLKAVIEWKRNKSKPIEEYSAGRWSRNTYLMTPRSMKKVLKRYKLNYTVLNADGLNDEERLNLLKENLKKWPIILLVANGQTKRKRFSRWRALTHWHYVSLWWYNEKKKIFYVYDSNTKRQTQGEVLEWTLRVPYKYILKEWWIWASNIMYTNYAISIKY